MRPLELGASGSDDSFCQIEGGLKTAIGIDCFARQSVLLVSKHFHMPRTLYGRMIDNQRGTVESLASFTRYVLNCPAAPRVRIARYAAKSPDALGRLALPRFGV